MYQKNPWGISERDPLQEQQDEQNPSDMSSQNINYGNPFMSGGGTGLVGVSPVPLLAAQGAIANLKAQTPTAQAPTNPWSKR